jgi:serine/threonine-protein kinase RsbW
MSRTTAKTGRLAEPCPSLRLKLSCTYAAVRRGSIQLRDFLATHGLNEKDLWACELAFAEGCNNVVQHTPAAQHSRAILVDASCSSGRVELRINDHTLGFDFPTESVLPADAHESGRGIFLMKALMDQVEYIRKESANCLVLTKIVTGI